MTMPNETWDYYSSRINQQKEIDEIEKQELLRNWGYLRDAFGEDWFKKEESKRHPLRWYLINQAPWCLRWIGELGFGIKCLNEKENFEDILNKLRLNIDFEETYSEFRVGYSLFKFGISFEFLKRSKKQKTPDVVINVDNRKIFLEITTKNTPVAFLNAGRNFDKLNDFFMSKVIASSDDLKYYFDVPTHLYPATVESIIELCEDLFKNVKKSGFEEFHIPSIIDIYILKKDNIERVPKEKRVIKGEPIELDELYRIKGTIGTKEVQLRTNNPGILIIFDPVLQPQPYKSKEYFDLENVKIIEHHINGFPNLSTVIIYVERYYYPDSESFVKKEGNYLTIQEYDEKLLILKNKVIILNEFAKHPLLPHEIEILKSI